MFNRSNILLLPPAIIYGLFVRIKNLLYDLKLLPSYTIPVHSICIGNLVMGGAGKTPLTEYIITLLKENGFQPVLLSRGYGRKTHGLYEADENSNSEIIGDEPYQIYKKMKIPVFVSENRKKGVEEILKKYPETRIIILDDAFQHRQVSCGLNIVLNEYKNPMHLNFYLPYGSLRDSTASLRRADIIVISKTPDKTTAVDLRTYSKDIPLMAYQELYFSYIHYRPLYHLHNPEKKIITEKYLNVYTVVLVTGIANPEPAVTYLKEFAANLHHFPFPDHHHFIPKEWEDISRFYEKIENPNKIIVVTEKDSVRILKDELNVYLEKLPIFVLPIEIHFNGKDHLFNEKILNYVRRNKLYHKKYT
ncbi:MAG: tetraacyldisaccharide 4'-kinase [Bacteroidia bacterium]|nr:tetraacyldisaccharide 4'-kinase [Bacteroidia bacterium]